MSPSFEFDTAEEPTGPRAHLAQALRRRLGPRCGIGVRASAADLDSAGIELVPSPNGAFPDAFTIYFQGSEVCRMSGAYDQSSADLIADCFRRVSGSLSTR